LKKCTFIRRRVSRRSAEEPFNRADGVKGESKGVMRR
jgi:hypothetical protein